MFSDKHLSNKDIFSCTSSVHCLCQADISTSSRKKRIANGQIRKLENSTFFKFSPQLCYLHDTRFLRSHYDRILCTRTVYFAVYFESYSRNFSARERPGQVKKLVQRFTWENGHMHSNFFPFKKIRSNYGLVVKIFQVDLKIGCIKSAGKQTIYNYKNLYKLMRLAPKLLNCKVNKTFFVKNHKILFS